MTQDFESSRVEYPPKASPEIRGARSEAWAAQGEQESGGLGKRSVALSSDGGGTGLGSVLERAEQPLGKYVFLAE